jgi:hypothetical protein
MVVSLVLVALGLIGILLAFLGGAGVIDELRKGR